MNTKYTPDWLTYTIVVTLMNFDTLGQVRPNYHGEGAEELNYFRGICLVESTYLQALQDYATLFPIKSHVCE